MKSEITKCHYNIARSYFVDTCYHIMTIKSNIYKYSNFNQVPNYSKNKYNLYSWIK